MIGRERRAPPKQGSKEARPRTQASIEADLPSSDLENFGSSFARLLAGLGRRSDAFVLLPPGSRNGGAKTGIGRHRRPVTNRRHRDGGVRRIRPSQQIGRGLQPASAAAPIITIAAFRNEITSIMTFPIRRGAPRAAYPSFSPNLLSEGTGVLSSPTLPLPIVTGQTTEKPAESVGDLAIIGLDRPTDNRKFAYPIR